MGARFYRLEVDYVVDDDGSLLASGPPRDQVRAAGDERLYRSLARLVDADDTTIAAAASRLGPLGPLGVVGFSDEPRLGWEFNEALLALAGQVDDVISKGGPLAVTLPAHLSLAAHLLMAFARVDPAKHRLLGHG